MIKFNCPACGKKIAVQDKHAGRKARCPQCKSIFTIPTLDSQEQSAEEKLPPQKGKDGPSPAYASATATPRGEKPPEGAKTNINRPNIDEEHKKLKNSNVMRPEPVDTPADNEKKAKSPSAAMGEKYRAQKLEGFAAADRHLFSATMDEKHEAQEPDEKNRAPFSKAMNDSREAQQIARQKKQRAVAIGVGAFILLLLGSCVSLLLSPHLFIHENIHGTPKEVINAITHDMDVNNRWAYKPKEPNLQGSYLVDTFVDWYDKWDNIYPAKGQQGVEEGCIKYVIEGKAEVYYHNGLSDSLVRATVVLNVFYSWNPETNKLKYITTQYFLHSVK